MESTQLAAKARCPRWPMLGVAAVVLWCCRPGPSWSATEAADTATASIAADAPHASVGFGAARPFRNALPPPVVEAQSQAEYDRVLTRARAAGLLLPDDDARVMRLRALLAKLSPFAAKWSDRAKNWQWEISVVRSNDARMVSLPSGKLIVYSALTQHIRLTDDELAMLFGHEMAHALREQVREELGEQSAPFGSVALSRLFGVTEFGNASAPAPAAPLTGIEFDAIDETEADVIGTDIAARAGFDPRAAIALWDKLALAARGGGTGSFMAMHPYTTARRQDLVKRLPDMLALYTKARAVAGARIRISH
ncbi:M48 family metallopeptidase [Trinickia sp. NRRL B-1857]|uniref:M48 family metallopeptidase n=1 Tax=Trinickia sp. NRRL B-1857 TaxID=3162879 RepID=UPI003D2981C1